MCNKIVRNACRLSLNVYFCRSSSSKPKDIQFIIIEDKENQLSAILWEAGTGEFWHFSIEICLSTTISVHLIYQIQLSLSVSGLQSEGLYRISGFSELIEDVKLAFDRGECPVSSQRMSLLGSVKYQYNSEGKYSIILGLLSLTDSCFFWMVCLDDVSTDLLHRWREGGHFLKRLRGPQHYHWSPQALLQRAAYSPHHIWCLPTLHRNRK